MPNPGLSLGPPEDHDSTLMVPADLRPRILGPNLMPDLPEFNLQGELGRGGMGIVYKALEKSTGSLVAVKVIRKDRLQHDESVRRFRREAQATARLNHPNIVRILDSDHTGDTHYLVMEYVAGATLERFVEQQGPVPFALACDFLRQAALGLAHAHEQGLVHRDIKPSNLMITPATGRQHDGAPAQLKILDMGVARVLQNDHHPGEALSTLTQGGSVIGTADFVAPEQLEDPHGADIRADLYSLGCTFYFLLVGEVPFPGGSLVSKLDKQRWQMPTQVNEVRREIPPAVAQVAEKLLAKKADARYQTPTDLGIALDVLTQTNFESCEPAGPEPRELQTLSGHSGAVTCVAVSIQGNRAASSGKDQTIRLWDIASGLSTRIIPRQPQEIRSVAFSQRGDKVAAAVGVSVRVWDVNSGQEIRRLSGHSAAVRSLVFSPDDKWLISASDDKTIRIWDQQSGKEVLRLSRHTAAVTCLAISRNGDLLLSGSRDQTLRRWDLRSGQEANVFQCDGGPILAIAVTADGRRGASAHFDTILRYWNLEDEQALGELIGHKQMVTGVAFLPDGLTLVSGSQDQSFRWWDTNTGCEIAMIEPHKAGILALAGVGNERKIVTAGADGTLRVIEIP